MASSQPSPAILRFGPFELDATAGRLLKSGIPIKLQPQPLRVLLLLIEHAGGVVTREEIQQCVWGDSTFVDFEHGINFSINQIRSALCDGAEKPRYIETIPRRGYRFIAPLEVGQVRQVIADTRSGANSIDATTSPANPYKPKSYWLLMNLLVCVGLAAGAFLAWRHGTKVRAEKKAASIANLVVTPRRSIAVVGFKNLSGQPSQAWISALLSEMITTDLAAGENLRVISGEEVARARVGLSLPDVSTLAPDTLARLHDVLGADFVLLGSYSNQPGGGKLRFDLPARNVYRPPGDVGHRGIDGSDAADPRIPCGRTDSRELRIGSTVGHARGVGPLGVTNKA
jgi:DNA-binding winged helix-turn-helix (wHTH) protein/TolB-like protein